jgi:orotidine-5'-phosphate decarboxylase
MMFNDLCKERFEKVKSVLCVGLDPIIEKFPEKKGSIEETICHYFFQILDNFHNEIFVVKPNIAFYEQYGIEGLVTLKKVINKAKSYKIPVILDAKRGDIGNTAAAYAKATFKEFEADAVTLSPYLGEDSVAPFFEYKEKGFFVLARTSNKGSSDFQLLKLNNNEQLYIAVTKKICEWNNKYSSGIGVVAGATHIEELKQIAGILANNNFPPILIPGVGTQGGDFNTVIKTLKDLNYPLSRIFINSSSKIIFANNEHIDKIYIDAVGTEIKKLKLS